ncbi:MAG: glycosyltransferase [Candidatus Bathyarchaeota archaeon]
MILFLTLIFTVLVALIVAYIIRHYLFTLAALYHKKEEFPYSAHETEYEPTVSILIPARNEEHVIERILQRMTELTYPKEKIEVIVIDDASTDRTSKRAKKFAEEHKFISVVHRGIEDGGKGKPDVLNCGIKLSGGF